MDFIDLHKENKKVILLIHPMLLTAEGMKTLMVPHMPGTYRYVIPELSGHGKSKEIFRSAEKEAEAIGRYLSEHQIDTIELAFGVSLGGVVLLNLLNETCIQIKKCVFEGCSLMERAPLQEIFFKKLFLGKRRKAIKDRSSAVREMSGMYGDQLGEWMTDCLIGMDENSVINIVRSCAAVRIPSLSKEEQKKCVFCYGSKDFDLHAARKTISKKLPYAALNIWKGWGHCNKITDSGPEYCKFLESQMEQ